VRAYLALSSVKLTSRMGHAWALRAHPTTPEEVVEALGAAIAANAGAASVYSARVMDVFSKKPNEIGFWAIICMILRLRKCEI
jgi:hypothetical protein